MPRHINLRGAKLGGILIGSCRYTTDSVIVKSKIIMGKDTVIIDRLGQKIELIDRPTISN